MKKYYYSIGEVCNLLEVKQHVLRYWEKEFPSLRPKKGNGRNRKYNDEDIKLLKQIKNMLYVQKYTIEGARKKLKNQRKEKKTAQIEINFKSEKEIAKENIKKQLLEIKDSLLNISD